MIIPLRDICLLIEAHSNSSFVLVGRVQERFTLFIETLSSEFCQFLDIGDLVVVSAPEGGDPIYAYTLLEMVRTWHAPLLVFPKVHPGSKRLSMVVSAGPSIELNCGIMRGTHPEQHLICASEALSGLILKAIPEGVEISDFRSELRICEYIIGFLEKRGENWTHGRA